MAYTVVTNTGAISTAYSHQRAIVRDSTGRLWTVYHRNVSGLGGNIFVAYSDNDGATWTEEAVTNISGDQYGASIAIDSSGYVHVAWAGTGWGTYTARYSIQYRKRTSSWQTQEAVTNIDSNQSPPSIAVDSFGYVHVAWHGQGWGVNTGAQNIQYRKRTSSWQAQESVTDSASSQGFVPIAIDSSNYVHVAWYGQGWGTNTGRNNIQYRKRTSSWQAQESVTDISSHQYLACIDVDSSNYVHVAWYGQGWGDYTAVDQIQYRKRTSSWQTQEAVTNINATQLNPSVVVDSSNYVHVAWYGQGWGTNTGRNNIQYRKRTSSWQTQVGITDEANEQYYPSLCPDLSADNYALVWTGYTGTQYNVYFEGELTTTIDGAVDFTGAGDIEATGLIIVIGEANFTGAGDLSAKGIVATPISYELVFGPTTLGLNSKEKRARKVTLIFSMAADSTMYISYATTKDGAYSDEVEITAGTALTRAKKALPLVAGNSAGGYIYRVKVRGRGVVKVHEVVFHVSPRRA